MDRPPGRKKLAVAERWPLAKFRLYFVPKCSLLSMCNLIPRSSTVKQKGGLVKLDLRPGIRDYPSFFLQCAEWPPSGNCDRL